MSTVLITGSGRRLGRGLALEFARHGWDVIIHYHNSKDEASITVSEIKALGVKSSSFCADVKSKSELSTGFAKAISDLDIPDVLVNNAAIYPKFNQLSDTSSELWQEVMDTNLTGYFEMSKIFAAIAKPGSRIVNIASMGAFSIWKGRIPYNVSKAAVIQLTKALALDLAPKFSVNSVSPGSIDIANESPAEDLALKVENIPMNRYGNVKDVFDAVYFLSVCSNYITGQNICVDGGYNLK